MNSNSNDLLNNFAEELKRRMSLVTEDGEYEHLLVTWICLKTSLKPICNYLNM